MQTFHTPEEIVALARKNALSIALDRMGKFYQNSEVRELAQKIKLEVNSELSQYLQYKGKTIKALPLIYEDTREWTTAKIIGIVCFSVSHRSVLCHIDFNNGIVEDHPLSKLKEI